MSDSRTTRAERNQAIRLLRALILHDTAHNQRHDLLDCLELQEAREFIEYFDTDLLDSIELEPRSTWRNIVEKKRS